MNELMIFEGNNVEVFELCGVILFNPKDVGVCLELSEDAIKKTVQRMSEKQVIKVKNSDIPKGTNCPFRKLHNTGENFITESGVYKMIFASRSDGAEKFQDWVTDEVLPTIRKTGGYVNNDDLFISTYLPFADDNTKLLFKSTLDVIKNQNEVIEVMKPKAEFHDAVVGSSDTVDMGQVAKVLNMGVGRNTLFDILREKKILRRNNEPYQDYIDNGWFRLVESKYQKPNGDTCINLKTVVFQRGVDGIRKMLQNLE